LDPFYKIVVFSKVLWKQIC